MDQLLEDLDLNSLESQLDFSDLQQAVAAGAQAQPSDLEAATASVGNVELPISTAMGAYGDLLSLPVFKMESLGFGEVDNGPRYLLMAPTSPLTKVSEISVSYLNKGQAYEVTLEALGNRSNYRTGLIRTSIQVGFFMFTESRLRSQEHEQWETWRTEHPGERVLDVESGYMVENLVHDMSQPNRVLFDWYASQGASVTIKINCLSTEFSAKRHGGEKGTVLRIEIDSYYQLTKADPFELFHAGNCHIKVFKDKGADRKHKQEMQKATSLPVEEQSNFRPGFSMSVFQDFCIDATTAPKQLPAPFPVCKVEPGLLAADQYFTTPSRGTAASAASVGPSSVEVSPFAISSNFSAPGSVDSGTDGSCDQLGGSATALVQQEPWSNIIPEALRIDSSVQETQDWLAGNGFAMHSGVFCNYAGVDLLKLQRSDMKELLGEAEGIRLNNAMQTRSIRPMKVFYVVQKEDNYYRGVYLHQCTVLELQSVLARHCQLLPAQIGSMQWVSASGVHVVVDRDVIVNIPTEATLRLKKELRSVDAASGLEEYDIHLSST